MITGAQALVDCLRREGVEHVFGIPGTMNLPVLDVLRETPEIRFILTRHEQGRSVHGLRLRARAESSGDRDRDGGAGGDEPDHGHRRRLQGFVPVISISGAQEIWLREKDASQDIDQVTLHLPITKWAYSIPAASKIQDALRRAFRIALAEPLGPVHLDVGFVHNGVGLPLRGFHASGLMANKGCDRVLGRHEPAGLGDLRAIAARGVVFAVRARTVFAAREHAGGVGP